MKIGIVTCHDVFNSGSSLQAYALSRFIAETGAQVQVIDYKPVYMYRLINFMEVESIKWQKNMLCRWLFRMRMLPYRLSLLPKFFNYRRFNRKYLPLTKAKYQTLEDLQSINDFDVLVCGSDQVWATTKNQCGEDPAFYLDFCQTAKKISYAASFGSCRISAVGEQCAKEHLHEFSAISVREQSGVHLIERLGYSATCVLDPVFLWDKDFWVKHCAAPKHAPQDYVLVYGYDNSVDMDALGREYAEAHGLSLVTLRHNNPYALGGPENFLWFIKNAKMVISSSFHAVSFSVIFETPFISVETGNKDLFERILNILDVAGLTGRVLQGEKKVTEMGPIDFTECRERIALARKASGKFLIGAIYDSKNE